MFGLRIYNVRAVGVLAKASISFMDLDSDFRNNFAEQEIDCYQKEEPNFNVCQSMRSQEGIEKLV